jgi:hypothetical protein
VYRKSHGSGLWITKSWLALSPWWTCDHGVARLLRGSGGHRDSSERERGGHRGSHQWRHLEAELQRKEIRAWVGVMNNGGALIEPFIGS